MREAGRATWGRNCQEITFLAVNIWQLFIFEMAEGALVDRGAREWTRVWHKRTQEA